MSMTDEQRQAKIEEIAKQIESRKVLLGSVEGTPCEVYTRIVGYYRSLKNWNRGKREEYGHRQVFNPHVAKSPHRLHVAKSPHSEPQQVQTEKRKSFIPEHAAFKGVAEFKEVAL